VESNVRVRSFALLGLLIGATACADNPATAPITQSSLLRRDAASGTGRGPTRFANSIKYRDKGLKHARGRAGIAATAASLEARALLGRDGITTLDVSTGVIDGPDGTSVLSKLQLKLFALDGALQTTTSYKGLSSPVFQVALPGRVRGSKLEVKGSIAAIDQNRTDVVTVSETVKLRPDLSVDHITAPTQSRVRTPVNISALISENNGDVGARSDCVLAVDGVEVDRAHGIWVDAGRRVSCLFNHVFPTTGTKQLTVSAVSVSPGDYQPSNNSAAGTIEIVLPTNEFSWEGGYYASRDWTGTSFSEGYWTSSTGDRAEWSLNQVIHRYDTWAAHAVARIGPVNGPLTFSFHDEIDGTLLNQAEFDPITDIPVSYQVTYEDPVFGTVHEQATCTTGNRAVPAIIEGREVFVSTFHLLVCTYVRTGPSVPPDQSFTEVFYHTYAGDVSYYAEHWENYHDGTPENQNGFSFSFNGETNYALGTLVFGSNYKFAMSVSGSDATKMASGTIHLPAPNTATFSYPYGCQDFSDPVFFIHSCSSANYTVTLIDVRASGSPEQ
jgi:hypothetical protein